MHKKNGLCFAALACLAAHTLAVAQTQQLERVEVTGSSILRVDDAPALPLQIITRADIQKSGAANVEQLMQAVSAMTSAGGVVAASAAGHTTAGLSGLSLRGLTPLRTLVLINGRRIAPYGVGFINDSVSVDVNSIPLAAIERIEILKDGASAIYGSDAIAGVVNFILRKDQRGVELQADYGDSTQGGGRVKRLSAAWGRGDLERDGYNLMLTGSYQKEGTLFGRDRAFANRSYNEATNHDATSGNTFPPNLGIPTVDANGDPTLVAGNPTAVAGCVAPYSFIDPMFGPDACRYDPAGQVALLPEAERAGLFASAHFALAPKLEGFVEASYHRNRQRTVIQPVPLSDQFKLPANNPLYNLAPYAVPGGISTATIVLSPSSPFYPTPYVTSVTGGATPDVLVRYRAAVSGNRDFTDIADAPRLALGVKGTRDGWDFDTAFVHSASWVRERVNDGYPVYSRILPLLNSGTVDFFGPADAATTAQLRAANFAGDAFSVRSALTSIAAKGVRELTPLPGGPLALALGSELRREHYLFDPSSELSQGDIAGYGGNQAYTNKSRAIESVFAEMNAPLANNLEASAAVRMDSYQDAGSAWTPKVGLRWQPSDSVLLRGSAGRGFRAPSLADLYSPATTGVTETGLNDPLRCPATSDGVRDCATQFPTAVGGNPNLKPEKSTNLTLGLVFEPTRNVSLAIDGFRIKVTNTIVNGLPASVILGDLAAYGQYVTRGPADPAQPGLPGPIISIDSTNINRGETRVAGYDIDAKWRIPADELGRFLLSFSGTYFLNYKTQNADGTYTQNVGNLQGATTGGVIPRWKTYQSVTWSRNAWDVMLALNWQSGYWDAPGTFEDPTDPAFVPRRVGPYETYDVQASYSGLKNSRVSLGVKNILNSAPPYTNQTLSFQSGYDPQYADPRGRFVYARLIYSFN